MEVLVTGGDTELGRVIAEGFRDAGHRVVISGARRDELEVTGKQLEMDAADIIVCDPTDPGSLAAARSQFPHHLDTIVNVPAPRWIDGDPRTYTPAQNAAAWHNALDATVLAPVLTLQTIGDHLRSGGAIVSVVPDSPKDGSADAAIKAALADWTAGQATHFGTRGITVNVVAAGRAAEPGYPGLSAAASPVAEEVTRMAVFLTTPSARHITGQVLHVSSGVLAHFG
jgi:NAD(P)-dependent dehydrogenase (short-subunit alcohol dehydrogenase family)